MIKDHIEGRPKGQKASLKKQRQARPNDAKIPLEGSEKYSLPQIPMKKQAMSQQSSLQELPNISSHLMPSDYQHTKASELLSMHPLEAMKELSQKDLLQASHQQQQQTPNYMMQISAVVSGPAQSQTSQYDSDQQQEEGQLESPVYMMELAAEAAEPGQLMTGQKNQPRQNHRELEEGPML